ncbi:rhomboid protease GluP [Paraliobacillus ryukyuensis]|uniref:Rhomboid family peptidase n=1 Tax=Paraliobacillus ryukyuensis TaxID=200904 RepID=A0A366EG78_9BACI|nr:rhomboid family intramembrane serine protease [Paraliobacillus ryukyuensis]RBP01397.1 rhomboid family peptidase [Paraliobacillus ryukyuensis]
MHIENSYYYFRLLDHFINQEGFELIYIHTNQSEIWLQRKTRKYNQVVRIAQVGFDWRNQLENDHKRTMMNSEKLARLFLGSTITLYNIYVAEHPPVDTWEYLKQSQKLKHKKFKEIKMFYLDKENREEELIRLTQDLNIKEVSMKQPDDVWELEKHTQQLQAKLISTYNRNQREMKQVFQHAKPFFTYVILVLNVLMFMLLEIKGGSMTTEVLIDFGAKYNPAMIDGEWWRIITSMFLHIGLLHLLMNMLALHVVGSLVERIYGNTRFVIIYFLAGIVGGLTSFAFSPQVSAGASGAIFGLFGALLFFGVNHRRIFFQTMGWNVIGVIIFNVIFGLVVPTIDNGAHIGGLAGGFIAAAIVHFPKKKQWLRQAGAFIAFLLICVAILFYGLLNQSVQDEAKQYDFQRQLQQMNELVDQEGYHTMIDTASRALQQKPNDYQAEFLFYRAFAYSHMEQSEKAFDDLKKTIELAPKKIPEAYYNLALIYLERNQLTQAKTTIEKAVELRPEDQSFKKLHDELFEAS